MNFAIILSGGIGSRMRKDGFPKQYIEVEGKPILVYTLEKFQKNDSIDKIIIVAENVWQDKIHEWIQKYQLDKCVDTAPAGKSRQESIYHGLKKCISDQTNEGDIVIIHDGVRPLLSDDLIANCIREAEKHDGCMPVLQVTDTVYQSRDGKKISALLERDFLYAGQAPEALKLKKYYELNSTMTAEQFGEIHGSSEIAYKNGLDIALIPGEDFNFKLTTPADLTRFESIVRGE